MQDDAQKPYAVETRERGFEVCDGAGRTVLACRDEGSAQEYATLLNEAYRRGYRAGYRQARPPRAPVPPPSAAASHLREGG
jgi:hypothetical protein